ncbi:hypothetical protein Dimus_016204, partial [Dionaea muscipula]
LVALSLPSVPALEGNQEPVISFGDRRLSTKAEKSATPVISFGDRRLSTKAEKSATPVISFGDRRLSTKAEKSATPVISFGARGSSPPFLSPLPGSSFQKSEAPSHG